MVALHVLLRPAIEAARRALRDLDADQIPADLRKIAGYAGGKLPPPLARALLAAFAKYDWLGEKAREAWPEADVDASGPEGAAALFLARPEGWELKLAEIAAAEGAASATAEGAVRQRESAALKKRLEATSGKLKEVERALGARIADLESQLGEARSEQKADSVIAAREDRAQRGTIEKQRRALSSLEAERDELEHRLREVRDELAAERRARREAEGVAAGTLDTASWRALDPIGLAARLDETARMARPPAAEGVAFETPGSPIEFPAAIGPDSAEAIQWLLTREEPITLLVDGYNVGFRLTGHHRPGPARDRLLPVLERVRRLARGALKVVAVFDSSEEAVEAALPRGPVKVVFTAPGRSADDEIAELAARIEGPVTVVTSDRAVRERVETTGALALWSESLVAWAARR